MKNVADKNSGLSNYKTILFDLDGTILNSFTGIRDSFVYALNTMGIPLPDEEFISKIAGPPMYDTLEKLNLDTELVNKTVQVYMDHYRENGWKKCTIFPGAEECLKELKKSDKILSTATSKVQAIAKDTLKRFGLDTYFDLICGANIDGNEREKEIVIGKALKGTNSTPSQTLMIGDRIFDINGGKHWNIPTIYVKWGFGNSTEEHQAEYIAHNFEELTSGLLHE